MKEQEFFIFFDVNTVKLGNELRALKRSDWFIQQITRTNTFYEAEGEYPVADYLIVASRNVNR